MAFPKLGNSTKGTAMHYSVGAVIKRDGKFLLLDRMRPPFGFAGPAGHVLREEDPAQALIREVQNETGLRVVSHKLLFEEEVEWNWCNSFIPSHYWFVFECEVEGEVVQNYREAKKIGWYSFEELQGLGMEEAWSYWFKKLQTQ